MFLTISLSYGILLSFISSLTNVSVLLLQMFYIWTVSTVLNTQLKHHEPSKISQNTYLLKWTEIYINWAMLIFPPFEIKKSKIETTKTRHLLYLHAKWWLEKYCHALPSYRARLQSHILSLDLLPKCWMSCFFSALTQLETTASANMNLARLGHASKVFPP